jgi:hypothetical protein
MTLARSIGRPEPGAARAIDAAGLDAAEAGPAAGVIGRKLARLVPVRRVPLDVDVRAPEPAAALSSDVSRGAPARK